MSTWSDEQLQRVLDKGHVRLAGARVVTLCPDDPPPLKQHGGARAGSGRKPRADRPIGQFPKRERKKWDYESRLAQQLEDAGISGFFVDEEYINERKLRGDIVFPLRKLIVEIQGEAHRVKQRFYDDIEKAQATMIAGYTLLPISTRQVKDGSAVGVVRKVMEGAA